MRTTALRLGLYGASLVAVFAIAFVTAGAVVPEETVQNWTRDTETHTGEHDDEPAAAPDSAPGLALEQDGYRLDAVSAPGATGEDGELTLQVRDAAGAVVTDLELSHEQELHLIVVRTDGSHFRHVHPERDEEGTWSLPWRWDAAGAYRVFADFVPAGSEGITISTTLEVAGTLEPSAPAEPSLSASTGEFTVTVDGDLVAGDPSTVTATVTRAGQPVTELEPYLGAFGHLVALREGDLAYLHVHPHGEAPSAGQTSGPEVAFDVLAPTPGRYLLYLDFQVAGEVHTATFVVDAEPSGAGHDDGAEHDEEGGDRDH